MCAIMTWDAHKYFMHPIFVLKNGCDIPSLSPPSPCSSSSKGGPFMKVLQSRVQMSIYMLTLPACVSSDAGLERVLWYVYCSPGVVAFRSCRPFISTNIAGAKAWRVLLVYILAEASKRLLYTIWQRNAMLALSDKESPVSVLGRV
jgi:hypothetical protein